MKDTEKKLERLRADLRGLGSVGVAFSGGVDSSFLLAVAHAELGERVAAITAHPESFPESERDFARDFCQNLGVRQIVLPISALKIEEFRKNVRERCYFCKRAILEGILRLAASEGLAAVVEGSNADDGNDFRPGARAIAELGVRSPLRDAGLTKAEIRELSRQMGLPTWDKPSLACLATRFPCGEEINEEKIARVERAERLLFDLGFTQVRVRCHGHGNLARIEICPDEFARMLNPEVRESVVRRLTELGFSYISLDLSGYRTGSMNG